MKQNLITTIILVTFLFHLKGISQPAPFQGSLLFNLTEKEHSGQLLKPEDFKNGKVQIISYHKESKLTYDTISKAFSFTTNGNESKEFAIVFKQDTMFIKYPSLPYLQAVNIKMPIPLYGKSFSFFNDHTYDAIHSNKSFSNFRIFNLCQGCFISDTYAMTEEIENQIRKGLFTHVIKLSER